MLDESFMRSHCYIRKQYAVYKSERIFSVYEIQERWLNNEQ